MTWADNGRLLDKSRPPTEEEIKNHPGAQSYDRLNRFEEWLNQSYRLSKEMKFPFGNEYGWGYKCSHKSAHLCYTFFEAGAFNVMLQLGDKLVPKVDAIIQSLQPKTQDLWENRYPCGEAGGWVHYQVLSDEELSDVIKLLQIKKKPLKQS